MNHPTKKLAFDDDVLAILREMEWQDDGKLGMITSGQLDRKLYLKLNKALEAMGGKWNRKRGGHVFKTDPRPDVEGLLEDGVLEVVKDGFFETPQPVIDKMIEIVNSMQDIWGGDPVLKLEPSAGLGAIASALRTWDDGELHCVEYHPQRVEHLQKEGFNVVHAGDFLEYTPGSIYDLIMMNPPFERNQDISHVRHAYNLLAANGVLVSIMSEHAFFASDSASQEFRDWLDMVGESEKLPEGSFKESGTGVNTRIVYCQK